MTTPDRKQPRWLGEGLTDDTVPELSRLDDAPRKLQRGALIKLSPECKKNKHRKCSTSPCSCECHLPKDLIR